MLANTADTGTLEYNTSDGTMWYLHALGRHVAATGEVDLPAAEMPALDDIIARHVAGTCYGSGVGATDGLLRQGADGVALTWMDARIDGLAVTPRIGKAVDINALWINGLGAVVNLKTMLGFRALTLRLLAFWPHTRYAGGNASVVAGGCPVWRRSSTHVVRFSVL
jgi:predicted glycogen debranching enzyme